MSGTSITIKGETLPLENAMLDLDAAAITCSYSEALANAFTGWMPVDVLLNMQPCKFPVLLRVIDAGVLQESQMIIIEFDGPAPKLDA
jgi:hypothetical protein